jgi:hypothetical protein
MMHRDQMHHVTEMAHLVPSQDASSQVAYRASPSASPQPMAPTHRQSKPGGGPPLQRHLKGVKRPSRRAGSRVLCFLRRGSQCEPQGAVWSDTACRAELVPHCTAEWDRKARQISARWRPSQISISWRMSEDLFGAAGRCTWDQ